MSGGVESCGTATSRGVKSGLLETRTEQTVNVL